MKAFTRIDDSRPIYFAGRIEDVSSILFYEGRRFHIVGDEARLSHHARSRGEALFDAAFCQRPLVQPF